MEKSQLSFFGGVNTKDGRRTITPSGRAFVYIKAPDIGIKRGVWGEKRRRKMGKKIA